MSEWIKWESGISRWEEPPIEEGMGFLVSNGHFNDFKIGYFEFNEYEGRKSVSIRHGLRECDPLYYNLIDPVPKEKQDED